MNNIKKAILITYIVAIIMFLLDQGTKQWVINTMPITVDTTSQTFSSHPSYKFLPFLWFTHVVNFGAAWSIFYGKRFTLLLLAGCISLGVIYFEFTSRKYRTKTLSAAIGFIMAGAAGNIFDRARMGYVTDFFDLRWAWADTNPITIMGHKFFEFKEGYNIFPIWNVADMSIDAGIALLIIYFFFQEHKIKKDLDTSSENTTELNKESSITEMVTNDNP